MIKCPKCGNTTNFTEVVYGAYEQPFELKDGKWIKPEEGEVNPNSQTDVKFECAECDEDCTELHNEFLDEDFG